MLRHAWYPDYRESAVPASWLSCVVVVTFDGRRHYRESVAGVAMGLIKEGNRVAVLTDILGDEDHLGDMDFKVAGTDNA